MPRHSPFALHEIFEKVAVRGHHVCFAVLDVLQGSDNWVQDSRRSVNFIQGLRWLVCGGGGEEERG